jgi:hypothetical protein
VQLSPWSFRDAPSGADPEAILPIVVMDSGLDAAHRPGMTECVAYFPTHFGGRFSENAFGPSM